MLRFTRRVLLGATLLLTGFLLTAETHSASAGEPSSAAVQSPRVEIGQPVPGFALPDLEGKIHDPASVRDEKRLVLIFFRGSW